MVPAMLGASTDEAEIVANRSRMKRYISIAEAEAGGCGKLAGPE
jgi:hypothetical protein